MFVENYNKPLKFREYGRLVQKMIEFTAIIEETHKREQAVKEIIEIMGQVNPHLRNVEDFRHKLWDHLFAMSDFKLEVNSPYTVPTQESLALSPLRLPYPHQKIQIKHYGKNVETLIKKATMEEDDEKRKAFTELIASYMKMVLSARTQESVNDETIKEDLFKLSKGMLTLDADAKVPTAKINNALPNNNPSNNNKGQQHNRNKNSGNNNRTQKSNNNNNNNNFRRKKQ